MSSVTFAGTRPLSGRVLDLNGFIALDCVGKRWLIPARELDALPDFLRIPLVQGGECEFPAGIAFSMEEGILTCEIENLDDLSADALEALHVIHKYAVIEGLVIKKASSLHTLQFIESLKTMELGQFPRKIEGEIPRGWLESATTISLDNCPFLKEIRAPNAKTANIVGCKQLLKVDFPQATSVTCQLCSQLSFASVPKAEYVQFGACHLSVLHAPAAALVECAHEALIAAYVSKQCLPERINVQKTCLIETIYP